MELVALSSWSLTVFYAPSSCNEIRLGDTVAGLVKLKSHEGVGCDMTPEGGNDHREDRQTTDAGVLGIPVIEMLMKHSVHVQQKCLFSKLIEYICIEEIDGDDVKQVFFEDYYDRLLPALMPHAVVLTGEKAKCVSAHGNKKLQLRDSSQVINSYTNHPFSEPFYPCEDKGIHTRVYLAEPEIWLQSSKNELLKYIHEYKYQIVSKTFSDLKSGKIAECY
ncbi:hypothetical protein MJT46_018590 [Ovis ammon polii x Ovis aries]|nr:hypothetical protein MJT46_018590 [Ovis ammon polii x Ovis aries]